MTADDARWMMYIAFLTGMLTERHGGDYEGKQTRKDEVCAELYANGEILKVLNHFHHHDK